MNIKYKILQIIHQRTATSDMTIQETLRLTTTSAGFDSLMVKLEDEGLICGFDEKKRVGRQTIKQRYYELTNKGRNLLLKEQQS